MKKLINGLNQISASDLDAEFYDHKALIRENRTTQEKVDQLKDHTKTLTAAEKWEQFKIKILNRKK